MIQEFVDIFINNKHKLEEYFSQNQPDSYSDIVKCVIELISTDNTDNSDNFKYGYPDPNKIHAIDDGDYQGTLLYVIPEISYQPSEYWFVFIGYGSCSGCDTLEAINMDVDGNPNKEQIKDYMTLALHIVQSIKKME